MIRLILVVATIIIFRLVYFNNFSSYSGVPVLIKFYYNRFKNRFNYVPGRKLPGINQVYVISMPQRKDYIKEQMDTLGYNVCYFDAIKPSDLSGDDYNILSRINDPRSRIYRRFTRLAVLMSFIMCFIDALEKGYNTITIFEDDISINVEQKLLENTTLEFSNSDLDIVYMGYCFLNCRQNTKKYNYLVKLEYPDLLCCHAICLRTCILPGLINYCFPMFNNSDEMFRDYYIKEKLKVGVPKYAYFSQNRKAVDSLNESIEDLELFNTCKFK
jgi:GR25 family glycosyltransferase involved in LPS biosynthesis